MPLKRRPLTERLRVTTPTKPVVRDSEILVCASGGGRYVSYEVSSTVQGVTCEKKVSGKDAAAVCYSTLPDGNKQFHASANCKDGCQANPNPDASCTASGKGTVR